MKKENNLLKNILLVLLFSILLGYVVSLYSDSFSGILIGCMFAFCWSAALYIHQNSLTKENYRPGAGIGFGVLIAVPFGNLADMLFLEGSYSMWFILGIALGAAIDAHYKKKFKYKEKLTEGQKKMRWVILGLVFLLGLVFAALFVFLGDGKTPWIALAVGGFLLIFLAIFLLKKKFGWCE